MGDIHDAAYNEDDRMLSNMMMDAWVRFVSTGKPSVGAIKEWPPFDETSDPYLVLDLVPVVAHGLRNSQLDFISKVQRATKK